MKKPIALLLAAALLFSCCACGRIGGYSLVDVPGELKQDLPALSEDAENLMEVTDKTPLIAALPEEGLYIYTADASVKAGVLIKFEGRIQYFPWIFTPQIAAPEAYVCDYNGDGLRDVAFTYCDTANDVKHNENLHILYGGEKKLTDHVMTWEAVSINVRNDLVITQKEDGFTASMYGKTQSFSLDAALFGAYMGVVADSFQDFTLGDVITLRIKPGLVFAERSLPVYDVLEFTAAISFAGEAPSLADMQLTVL